jgi:hypothetical protein
VNKGCQILGMGGGKGDKGGPHERAKDFCVAALELRYPADWMCISSTYLVLFPTEQGRTRFLIL